MNIAVYDDIVPYKNRSDIFYSCVDSRLKLGWQDQDHHELADMNLFGDWGSDKLVESGLWESLKECIKKTPWFTNKEVSSCKLNLIRPNDIHLIHSHGEEQVALYYVNTEWRDGWYGETLFYSESTKEVEFTSPYVPGRIILFDGCIPHAIRPQSVAGPKYRLSISTFFV